MSAFQWDRETPAPAPLVSDPGGGFAPEHNVRAPSSAGEGAARAAAVKTAMQATGHPAGPVRDPLLPLGPADAARIERLVAVLRPQPPAA